MSLGFHPWSRTIPRASEQLSPCTTTIEPVALEPGGCNYQLHVPHLRQTARPRACALQQEKPPQWEAHAPQLESSLCLLQLEKNPHGNQDPAQPKIKLKKKKQGSAFY